MAATGILSLLQQQQAAEQLLNGTWFLGASAATATIVTALFDPWPFQLDTSQDLRQQFLLSGFPIVFFSLNSLPSLAPASSFLLYQLSLPYQFEKRSHF